MTQPTDPSQPQNQPGAAGAPQPGTPGPPAQPVPSPQPYGTPAPQGTPAAYPASSQPGAPISYGAPGYPPPGQGGMPAGYPAGGYPPPMAAQRTDGVSIAALITGILFLAPIPIVLGILGIRRTGPGKLRGRGMAIAGLILGVISTLFWIFIAATTIFVIGQVGTAAEKQCKAGDMQACDVLAVTPGISSSQHRLADTCNGTQPAGSLGRCGELQYGAAASAQPSADMSPDASADELDDDALADLGGEVTAEKMRAQLDAMMPDSLKESMQNPATRAAAFGQFTAACKTDHGSNCDTLGYFADKSKEPAEFKLADTCGGKYPEGGKLLLCAYSAR